MFQCGYLEGLPLNTTYPSTVKHARHLLTKEFVHPDVLRRGAHTRRPQHYLGMMPSRILSQF